MTLNKTLKKACDKSSVLTREGKEPESSKMIICGIISAILGLVLYIVGIATNAWMSVGYQESGLWRVCGTIFGVTQCVPTLVFNKGSVNSWYMTVKKQYFRTTDWFYLALQQGICGALAGAIYAGYAKSYAIAPGVSVPFGYSFYMIWVQALFTKVLLLQYSKLQLGVYAEECCTQTWDTNAC
uniref:Uncharacterized protein n=1 Tax=Branchiostoma floridae TaxID=7739 RepID=C3Z0R0_BRAFL|eukprot:XP_002597802.1 hypothetical protein BRAFLDRAFT_129388 [Branchiostoma floridae]